MLLNNDTTDRRCHRLHGVDVCDPYSWLEDGASPAVRRWVLNQQRNYDAHFARLDNLEIVRERVKAELDIELVDQPSRVGSRYFYRKRGKGMEQASIYARDLDTGSEQLLIRPPAHARYASVSIHRISSDGSLLAYELKSGGSDMGSIHVVETESRVELPGAIESGYARGFVFASDQTGYYYCQEWSERSADHAIRFHRFAGGAEEEIVFAQPRSPGSRMILTSDEVNLAVVSIYWRDNEQVFDLFIARRSTPTRWKKVIAGHPKTCRPYIAGGRIYLLSFIGAANGEVVELYDDGSQRRVVIPEQSRSIKELIMNENQLVFTYLLGWYTAVESWSISGRRIGRVKIPAAGTIRLLQPQSSETLFCVFESLFERPTIYEFLSGSAKAVRWYPQVSYKGRRRYQVTYLSARSKDGTAVPLMLVSQSGPGCSRNLATLMTGYGGFGTPVTPQYSVLVSIMLELGCKFVLTRVRGGGEYGQAWHEAGRDTLRQNSFDDFIAVAEWLHELGITGPNKLGMFGGSNAGLLVGVALTQRPELFAAALCIAPLLDMIRYEAFDQSGRWRHEYGSVDNEESFRALYAYSPYHHVRGEVDYPAVLFVSGDKDNRCNPAHVRKMVAALQERAAQKRPILVDYNCERGHSPTLPLSVRVESLARRIVFLCKALNIAEERKLG